MEKLCIAIFALAVFFSCSKPDRETWYKGNTHSHTVICGHADTHPDTVARWYLDRGYNFLILSEHNHFINPDSVNLPPDRREDFILIPGEELTDHKHVHTTGMNVNRVLPAHRPEPLPDTVPEGYENFKVYLMQKHTDSIRGEGGIPILNHPNWESGIPASDIQQVNRLNMIELFNGHPEVNNFGNDQHPSMEQKWDSLLTAGRKIYAVSSDDAHYFHEWGPEISNPGRGWVMVKAPELTPTAISNAMEKGDFYATSGVILSKVEIGNGYYNISVDVIATRNATSSEYVAGYRTDHKSAGYTIELIADGGEVIEKINGTSAWFDAPVNHKYIRAKITYTRSTEEGGEQFFAWTQPLFLTVK
ncbi:MAG: CehA/McbA family metallohydrolase [Cyclobacteriaceae bacterium]|nr:CehA/McbA family metallohydrolase [Cyclobacteriaceae bacterium]